MHLLSKHNYNEFLATPQLVRFELASGHKDSEPTLLIKASTLSIKYLLKLQSFRLVFFRVDERFLGYGVTVADDPKAPMTIWSIAERQVEIDAIVALMQDPRLTVFLFNEATISVAWGVTDVHLSREILEWVEHSLPAPDSHTYTAAAVSALGQLGTGITRAGSVYTLDAQEEITWTTGDASYITNRLATSTLNVESADEGGQQEHLGLWLIDGLDRRGAVRGAQVAEPGGMRELCDLLITYEFGSFLFESKGLSILDRAMLPSRDRLAASVKGKLVKAARQLKGACANLKRGFPVFDSNGREVSVERSSPPHVIIVVPELSLLQGASEFGGRWFQEFAKESGGIPHILDLAELLRVVQSAQTIAELSNTGSVMMAFDHYLVQRFERALKCDDPSFQVILRVTESGADDESLSS